MLTETRKRWGEPRCTLYQQQNCLLVLIGTCLFMSKDTWAVVGGSKETMHFPRLPFPSCPITHRESRVPSLVLRGWAQRPMAPLTWVQFLTLSMLFGVLEPA